MKTPMRPRPRSLRQLREALHDELGPRLFAVATKLSLLQGELQGKAARQARKIFDQVQAARRETRRLIEGGAEEEKIDLIESLKKLARENGGRFAGSWQTGAGPEAEVASELYRIAREAAHNAVKHGGGKGLKIRLKPGLLEIEDTGRGPTPGWKEGMGIKTMKRRARRLGGGVTLQRVAPGRTILACHFLTSKKRSAQKQSNKPAWRA